MEKFNLLDLIAKLGEAVLSGTAKNTGADADANGDNKAAFAAAKTPDLTTPQKQEKPASPSTSEQAFVEMLRRHDRKSKEIDEKIKAESREKVE